MKRDIGALFPELEKDLKPYTAEATTGILPFQEICRLIDGGRINAAGGIERGQQREQHAAKTNHELIAIGPQCSVTRDRDSSIDLDDAQSALRFHERE